MSIIRFDPFRDPLRNANDHSGGGVRLGRGRPVRGSAIETAEGDKQLPDLTN